MPARDEPGPGRFSGHNLSEDTTDTLLMRPVSPPQRPGAAVPPPPRRQPRSQHQPPPSGEQARSGQSPSSGEAPPGRPSSGPPTGPPPPDDDRPPQESPPPGDGGGGGGALRAGVRTVGELFITFGIVILLFVVYELYVTNLFSAAKQAEASQNLAQRWAGPERKLHVDPVAGKAFARIYIPSFGVDYEFTIQEGVGAKALSVGPGHYVDSAMPGAPGNFAIAGHRVGKGAPFNDLDLLASCDAIVVETATDFFVYRVLPMPDEIAGWKQGDDRRQTCGNVSTLRDPSLPDGGPYGSTVGRKIVDPGMGSAIAPVPYKSHSTLPKSDQVSLLTMTTCHPQFSAQQRLIIHAVLVQQFKKGPESGGYKQVLSEIGAVNGR